MTMPKEKTKAELLAERKDALLTDKVAENKKQQIAIIAHCNNQIGEHRAQITKLQGIRADAQDLLDELEVRYPVVIAEPEPIS